MKALFSLAIVSLVFSAQARAENACYSEMSEAAYKQYAADKSYSLVEAKNAADLFQDSFTTENGKYVFGIELAEQYVTDSESGYYPGEKYKLTLTNTCELVSVQKIK